MLLQRIRKKSVITYLLYFGFSITYSDDFLYFAFFSHASFVRKKRTLNKGMSNGKIWLINPKL